VDRVFTQRGNDAPAAEDDLLYRIVVGEHRDDDIGLTRACRAIGDLSAFVAQCFCASWGSIPYHHAMGRFH
jgi:hypothetical protein